MNSICISSFSNSKASWVYLVPVFLYVWDNKYMDKNGVSHIEIKVTYDFRCVYSLQYHIVWCTKYPKKVFLGAIEKEAAGYSMFCSILKYKYLNIFVRGIWGQSR